MYKVFISFQLLAYKCFLFEEHFSRSQGTKENKLIKGCLRFYFLDGSDVYLIWFGADWSLIFTPLQNRVSQWLENLRLTFKDKSSSEVGDSKAF